MKEITDFFPSPSGSFLVSGSSKSGKTEWSVRTINMLVAKKRQETGKEEPYSCCHIFYAINQSIYDTINIKKKIFHDNFSELEQLDAPSELRDALVLIDDAQPSLAGARSLQQAIDKLFTIISHHYNTCIIMLVQNLYPQDGQLKQIIRNSDYVIVLRSRQSTLSLSTLQRIYFTGSPGALLCASSHAFGQNRYLLIDMRPDASFAIKSGILPGEPSFVYRVNGSNHPVYA